MSSSIQIKHFCVPAHGDPAAEEELNRFLRGHSVLGVRQRGIMAWQAVVGLDDGKLLQVRPDDKPFPIIEVRESLPDGTEFKAVWSLVKEVPVARLVTVHFFDR